MQLQIDGNGLVLGYATVGDLSNAIEFEDLVPDGFEDSCWKFKLVDGLLVEMTQQEKRAVLKGDRFKLSDEDIAEILMEV